MRATRVLSRVLAATAVLALSTHTGLSQTALGTAFTYQGQLQKAGTPLTGTADFQFSLWDAVSGGTQIGTTVSVNGVTVTDGLFTVTLDFGAAAFAGEARWLEIAVRSPAGSGTFTTLSPRQELKPAPYALALPGLWTQQNATCPNLIGGYSGNTVTTGVYGATIGGGGRQGGLNVVTDHAGTVGGGSENQAGDGDGNPENANHATVAGGWHNLASGPYATVGGGKENSATESYTTVGGGVGNLIGFDTAWSTISGGSDNVVEAGCALAAIGGGSGNHAWGIHATIGGGGGNKAGSQTLPDNDWYATVGGGRLNVASGQDATVGGGEQNEATAGNATVGGGELNKATSGNSAIGGGYGNLAGGPYATIPGGRQNRADGESSLAAGYGAQALHSGCFVWKDNTGGTFASTANNQFLIRAAGGVGINRNDPQYALDVQGDVRASGLFRGTATNADMLDGADGGKYLYDVSNTGRGMLAECAQYADNTAITFSTPFAYNPVVVATAQATGVIATVSSWSPTGFQLRLTKHDGTAYTSTTYVHWIAIGRR